MPVTDAQFEVLNEAVADADVEMHDEAVALLEALAQVVVLLLLLADTDSLEEGVDEVHFEYVAVTL